MAPFSLHSRTRRVANGSPRSTGRAADCDNYQQWTRFENGGQFSAWLGLVPWQNCSGAKSRLMIAVAPIDMVHLARYER
jgi:hypothetical protein